ncbi:hypothetical protein UB47_14860 [Pseudomonas sp. 5]|nr:hypothetical protein UB47_14860 [Pseudomonas sp. 5]
MASLSFVSKVSDTNQNLKLSGRQVGRVIFHLEYVIHSAPLSIKSTTECKKADLYTIQSAFFFICV